MDIEEFGIPFFHNQKIWRVGATMRLVSVQKRMAGGRRDVTVSSTGLFHLQNMEEVPAQVPYPLGDIHSIDDWASWPLGSACAEARDALIEAMKVKSMDTSNLENQGLVRLVQHLGIDALQRAEILNQPSLDRKQLALLERLELTRRLIEQSPLENGTFFVN